MDIRTQSLLRILGGDIARATASQRDGAACFTMFVGGCACWPAVAWLKEEKPDDSYSNWRFRKEHPVAALLACTVLILAWFPVVKSFAEAALGHFFIHVPAPLPATLLAYILASFFVMAASALLSSVASAAAGYAGSVRRRMRDSMAALR